MGLINLTFAEVEIIKASIELRRTIWADAPNLIAELEDILKRLSFPIIDLKPLQRARLIGCIKEYLVYPNKKLFELSDYEILCLSKEVKDKMREVDIGSNAMNKLKKKKEKQYRIFEDTMEKINRLLIKGKIYFSEQGGKIYKIGVVGIGGMGIVIRTDGSIIEDFRFEKIDSDWFMTSATPREVIEKINLYGIENKLTENHVRMKKILEELYTPI